MSTPSWEEELNKVCKERGWNPGDVYSVVAFAVVKERKRVLDLIEGIERNGCCGDACDIADGFNECKDRILFRLTTPENNE